MTTYTPGQFARITVTFGCKKVRAVRTSDDDWAGDDGYTYSDNEVTDVAQFVAIKFPEVELASHMVKLLRADGFHWLADQIEEQTKPPRIPEPSLYAVVSSEDDRGLTTYFWHSHGGWHGENGSTFEWDDLVNPVLIRPGIEDGAP